MRNWIIGAAAMLAVVVPGVAAAGTGYIDLGYARSNLDSGGPDTDVDTWAAGGVAAFDAHALGVQLDARVGSAEPESGSSIDFWGVGGHLFKRNDTWLVGGYAGIGNVDAGSGSDTDEWTVAAEAQYYMAQTTLTGALSYSEADDANLDTTAIDLGVRHFVNDNFAIDANIAFASLEMSGSDTDATSFGVGGEYQLASVPVSIFGGYQHTEVDDANLDVDSFGIGIRYNWGGTLFDRDRHGASLPRRAGGFSRMLGGAV
jgi:hypothetical protein